MRCVPLMISNPKVLIVGQSLSLLRNAAITERVVRKTAPNLIAWNVMWWISVDYRRDAERSVECFVLATNDLDDSRLSSSEVLSTSNSQHSVERRFHFLRSLELLVSLLFLKEPERTEALLMLMTLCLLVYAAIYQRIRHKLKRQSRFFSGYET